MDILKFLHDYRIDHITEGEYAHKGWANVNCPFCTQGKRPYRLGINLGDSRCSCWQCGGKHIVQVIRALAKCNQDEAKRIHNQYRGHSAPLRETTVKVKVRSQCRLPVGAEPLKFIHDDYLIDRNFDPELLEKTYGLMGTGRRGYIRMPDGSEMDYKYRLIAPIYFENKLVSFQGRDITGQSKLRYKACPSELEAIDHKNILYGYDLVEGDSCLVVEGITDEWRMGPDSVATFGTGYKAEQVALLVKRFRRVFLLFDPEPAAQETAEELAWILEMKGREGIIVDLNLPPDIDPGKFRQDDANHYMREMGLRGWNR